MKRVAYVFLMAAPLLVGAAKPSTDWKREALAAAAPFIDRANAEWASAIRTGNAAVMSAPYARDGLFIGPDGTVFRGQAAVRQMYSRRPSGVKVLSASIKSDGRAAADPSHVYEWGSATLKVKKGKAVRESGGRYHTVWHRDGKRWLITRNIAF